MVSTKDRLRRVAGDTMASAWTPATDGPGGSAKIKNGDLFRPPPDGRFGELAGFFKVFGDETRIKILHTLFAAERSVGELAGMVGMSQSSVSHQLRLLKDARIVRRRREGKTVYYALDDDHVKTIFDEGMSHVSERNGWSEG